MKKCVDDNTCIPDNSSVDPSQLQLSSLDFVPLLGLNNAWGGRGFVGDQAVLMSQDPFVLDTSLRSNNLYGSELDKTRLERVVRACCFNTDEKAKPDGLSTFVGGHRRKLSGGQKQRMCLASVCSSTLMQCEADSNTHPSTRNQHYTISDLLALLLDTLLHVFQKQPPLQFLQSRRVDVLTNPHRNPLFSFIMLLQPILIRTVTFYINTTYFTHLFVILVLYSLVNTIIRSCRKMKKEEALEKKERKDTQTGSKSDSFNLNNILSADDDRAGGSDRLS
ncbi:hypothetical protein BLNAU_14671 [Blattamonas nauphoetae]|uniref:ABC transporter domain-containing protein n=1 Tax=Blattamonas nauphoetae TaxID=2049346 RepID=A0ABQ9XGT4_9EUKA|nr:hypothetical protein BLNAU_14671 [Blattamonas nauphoetae]